MIYLLRILHSNPLLVICALLAVVVGARADAGNVSSCGTARCALNQLLSIGRNTDPFYTMSAYAKASVFIEDLSALSEAERSIFLQFYGKAAMLSGDYLEADRWYPAVGRKMVPDRYHLAVPADQLIIQLAKGSRVIFFNELHGRAQTRVVLLALLPELKAMGFTHLALETLGVNLSYKEAATCEPALLRDSELAARGMAINSTGFYSRDPVYGELIRIALQLGFELVAYDVIADTQSERMEGGATILACLMNRNENMRLVGLAGMANIGEGPAAVVDDYSMADWFRRKTGIDPVTVSTYELVDFDSSSSISDAEHLQPGQAYVLSDSEGNLFTHDFFDVSVYIHGSSDRNSGSDTWLTLRGLRSPAKVSLDACEGMRPCIVSAMRLSDPPDAVASDKCIVFDSVQDSCNLYLPHGEFHVGISGLDRASRAEKILEK